MRTTTVSNMPRTPQRIQAGKKEPRMLNEGAREQPSAGSNHSPYRIAMAAPYLAGFADDCQFLFMSGSLPVQQIAGFIRQGSQPGQQLCASGDVGATRVGQGALRRNHIDLAA